MIRKYTLALLSLILLSSSLQVKGAVIQSVTDGSWTDSFIWNCGCVPTSSDTVIINNIVNLDATDTVAKLEIGSFGDFTLSNGSASFVINGDLVIDNGGFFTNGSEIFISGNYINNGIHSGNKNINLTGATVNVSGTGLITNGKALNFNGGNITILTGTNLYKSSGSVKLSNGAHVSNNGTFRCLSVTGDAGVSWTNNTNSTLATYGSLNTTNITFNFNSQGNTVIIGKTGTIAQNVPFPYNGVYYNLTIDGNNASALKVLTGNISIYGSLNIGTSTLSAVNGTNNYKINLKGNWTNSAGAFIPGSGTVSLIGTNQTITDHDTAAFYNLSVSSTSTTTLMSTTHVGHTLTIQGNLMVDNTANPTIFLDGKWLKSGHFTPAQGKVVLQGPSVQFISGGGSFYDLTINNSSGVGMPSGADTVEHYLDVQAGTLTTGDRLVLTSNASTTANVGPLVGGASVSGMVTVQRYHVMPVNGWINICSPVSGQTLADWDDDFITTGFPGSDYPTYFFDNIRSYDETQAGFRDNGLLDATDISDSIHKGEGFQIFTEAGVKHIDVKGSLYQGNINLPVSFTDSGSPDDDGWNLVANPYASTIDWDDVSHWTKTNINDAIYVWDATLQQYTSYISGAGTNGGSSLIPSSQSFWVKANAASPALTVTELAKTTSSGTYRDNNTPLFSLRVTGNGFHDEAVIRFNQESTNNFDSQFDAMKLDGGHGTPNISTQASDQQFLAINTMPSPTAAVDLPVKITVGASGTYTILPSNTEALGNGMCLILEDQFTGDNYPLSSNSSFTVQLSDTTTTARFILHMQPTADLDVSPVACYGQSNGKAVAEVNGQGPYTYTWKNSAGNVIASTGPVAASADSLQNVAAGDYSVDVTNSEATCSTSTMQFQVAQPEPVGINYEPQNPTCPSLNDGLIALSGVGGTEPYDLTIESGDSVISGENGSLGAGTYTLHITDANGCEANQQVSLSYQHNPQAQFNAPANVNMSNGGATVNFENNSQDATSYEWNFADGSVNSTEENPSHVYAASGQYLVQLTAYNGACENQTSQIVSISASSGLETLAANGVKVWDNHNAIEMNISSAAKLSDLKVYNILGQLLYAQSLKDVSGQLEITNPHFKGVLMIELWNGNNRVGIYRMAMPE